MASGNSRNLTVECQVCRKRVEIYESNVQSSMNLHFLKMHPTLHVSTREQSMPPQARSRALSVVIDTFNCPVCSERVVVCDGDLNESIQEHFKSHNRRIEKPPPEDQLYTFNGINKWIEESEKSEVKGNYKGNPRYNQNNKHSFNQLPLSLKQHRGYFIDSGNKLTCTICVVTMDSSSVGEHMRTKTHEDNIILFLKEKVPTHMQNIMEFISFYGSNLCCNLCRCKIELISLNAYETIVNIVSHNADELHISRKSGDSCRISSSINDNAIETLQTLAERYQLIRESRHWIDTTIEPTFKCKLCDIIISYYAKDHNLANNFVSHFNSLEHKKSQHSFNVLMYLETMGGVQENHKFVIKNGDISCSNCNCIVEADTDRLMLHITGESNRGTLRQSSTKSYTSSHSSFNSTRNGSRPNTRRGGRPQMNHWKSCESVFKNSSNLQVVNSEKENKGRKESLLTLLDPLRRDFGNVDYIIESQEEDNEPLCLICNCNVPRSTIGIRTHIGGNRHRQQLESQIQESTSFSDKTKTTIYNSSNFVDNLFEFIPATFLEDKEYIEPCPIDGYVKCVLCNGVINPHYLQDHLQDARHVSAKQRSTSCNTS